MAPIRPLSSGFWLAHFAAAFFLVVQLFPVIWIVLAALKSPEELASRSAFDLPTQLNLANFQRAFETTPLLSYIANSAIVALLTIGLTVALAAPAAYSIEKLRFFGSRKVLTYFLLGLMIPVFVSLLPMFQALNLLGLRNTYWAVVLPQVGFHLPVAIYIYTGFMRSIPDALLEAAAIDGAGPFSSFWMIMVPLTMNATITIVVFTFMFVWNEFVFANTFLTQADVRTLPVGLNDFVGEMGKRDYGATYAAIVVSLIPTVALYLVLNKRVIDGMTAGAVRG